MQKITIKKKVFNKGNSSEYSLYYVQALSLKNSDNKVQLLVPHPQGTDVMEFNTLEEAVAAIKKAGFDYELPSGETISEENLPVNRTVDRNDIEKLLLSKFKSKVNDANSSVASSALTSLAVLNTEEGLDIFVQKLGEDNEKIRNAAVEGIVNYKGPVLNKLIDALTDTNWVTRNSAILCLVKLSENTNFEPEKLLIPIINRFEDENTIVQASALLAAGQIYKNSIINQAKNRK